MCDMSDINTAFTRYLKKYMYLILTASDLPCIRYTSIRIRNQSYPHSYMYPSLSVFESKSGRKCGNKYNIIDIRPYLIRLHPYLKRPLGGRDNARTPNQESERHIKQGRRLTRS